MPTSLKNLQTLTLSPHWVWPINIVLAGVIAYCVVHLFLSLINPVQPALPVLPAQAPTMSTDKAAQNKLNATPIISAHLFGQAHVTAPVQRSETPPDTRLNLILKGTVYSTVPENATAIIAQPGGETRSYRRGQSVPGGAVVRDIYADHVILSRSGRFETLRLHGKNKPADTGFKVERTPVAVNTEKVDQYRKKLLTGEMSLLDLVSMTVVQRDGQQIGYRLHPGQNSTAFREVGLKNNDILVALNGISLDSPANGSQALKLLRESRNFQLDILRNGNPVALSIGLDE